MAINLIIGCVSVLMAFFVLVRLLFPATRDWFERPKHQFFEHEQRFQEDSNES